MKHLTFMMALLTGFVAFVASAQAQPVARFESTEIDYGKIAAGSNPVREFKFKNFGTEPLLITDAQGSSGAVIPSWPPAPIMPGMSEARVSTLRRCSSGSQTTSISTALAFAR